MHLQIVTDFPALVLIFMQPHSFRQGQSFVLNHLQNIGINLAMRRFFSLFFLLLPGFLPAATLWLAGVDTEGNPFPYGSGTFYYADTYQPALDLPPQIVVSNQGGVAFLAADAEPSETLRYLGSFFVQCAGIATPAALQIRAGCEIFYNIQMLHTGINLHGTTDLTQFVLLANDYLSPSSYKSKLFALQREGTTISEHNFWSAAEPSPIAWPSWRSVYASAAQRLLLYTPGSGEVMKFDRLESGWSEATPLTANNTDLPAAWASIADRRVAFSADGSTVYFSTSSDLKLSDDPLEGTGYSLYCFDLSSGVISFLASIGTAIAQPSCSADGEIAVIQCTRLTLCDFADNSQHSQIVKIKKNPSGNYDYELLSLDENNLPAGTDCYNPAISADGRFVTFSSSAKLTATETGGIEQIYRYDSASKHLELISSSNGVAASKQCYRPAISANGRYVGFATAANLTGYQGDYPQVVLADCGFYAAIADFTSASGNFSTLELSGNFRPEETTVTLLQALTAGQLQTAAGQEVVAGQAYPAASFPWHYFASGTPGSVSLSLRVQENGQSVDLVTVLQLQQEYVSLTDTGEHAPALAPGEYYEYGGLSCSEDGSRVSFVSTAPLSSKDQDTGSWYDANVHLRDFATGQLTVFPRQSAWPLQTALSGDGRRLLLRENDNKLYSWNGTAISLLAENVSEQFALSVDGSRLAYIATNGTVYWQEGSTVQALATDARPEVSRSLALNRDGSVLVYVSTSGLKVWHLATGAVSTLLAAQEVKDLSLNMSGSKVYFRKDASWQSLDCGGHGREPQELLSPADANYAGLLLSGNGRYVTYTRKNGSLAQQYHLDLHTGSELCLSEGGDATCVANGANMAISGAGTWVYFTSLAANLAGGDTNGQLDIFRARIAPDAGVPAELTSKVQTAQEDEESILPLTFTSARSQDAIPTLLDTATTAGGTVRLRTPSFEHPWYSVVYLSAADYVGQDSFQLTLWDGTVHSAAQTVAVTVQNVNDPPQWLVPDSPLPFGQLGDTGGQITWTVILAEGETAYLALPDCLRDPDLANPAPDIDSIAYSLPDGPKGGWADIDGSKLQLSPGYDLVDKATGSRDFIFTCRAADLAGEQADLQVKVTVQHRNRPPKLGVTELRYQQQDGVRLDYADFAASDPDGDAPKIAFALPPGCSLQDKDNAALSEAQIAAGLASESFPLRLLIPGSAADQLEEMSAWAVDEDSAVSAPIPVIILLRAVTFRPADLWSNSEDSGSLKRLCLGWNLLCVPYSLTSGEAATLFGAGTALWFWAPDKDKYMLMAEDTVLAPGQGFWLYLADPKVLALADIVLQYGRTVPAPWPAGWNLSGPSWQDLEQATRPAGRLWELSENVYTASAEFNNGPYWFLQP